VNEDLKFDFRGHYGEVDAAAISFNGAFALPVFGVFPPGSPFFEDVNDHDFLFQANINPSNEQESRDFSVKMDWDLDWGATVTSWFLYSKVEQNFLTDGTSGAFGFFAFDPATSCPQSAAALAAAGVPFPAPTFNTGNPIGFVFDPTGSFYGPYTATTCDGYQYQERNQEDKSFEIRLTSNVDQQLRWQLGFYYLDLDREVGVATGVDPNGAIPRQQVSPLTEALVSDDFTTEVFAFFGNFQYDITDRIEGSVALRYDREDRKVSSAVPSPAVQRSRFIDYTNSPIVGPCNDGIVGSPLNPAFITDFTTCATSNAIPNRDDVWDEIQPKISLRWDVTDDHTLFASWGRGFKSGGFNNQGSAATVDLFFNNPAVNAGLSISDDFDKETSDAFEVGFKSTIGGGRVHLEGAVYHTMIDDMQIFNFFVGPFGLLRVVSSIDEVSITGGELGATIDVNDQVTLYGGVNYLSGSIDKNRNRPQTKGNEVPYAPEYTLNFGGEFVEPGVFMGSDFVVRTDYSVVGPTWFSEVQNGDETPTLFTPFGFGLADWSLSKRDSYGLVNVRAGLEHDSWGVHAFAKNLLDNDYLSEVIPAPEFGGSFIHPGSRRTWGIEMSYRF
jgi:iron complex outermembrane receptor protein